MGKRTHSHAFEGGKRHPPDKLAPAAGGTLAILGLDGCGRTTPARRINTPLELQGGELSLYTVASVKEENGYHFDVTTGKLADEEGVSEIPSMTSKELSKVNFELAQKLEKPAAKVEADRSEKIVGGEVSFTGLKPGLYLIVQTKLSEGDRKVNSFLISIPDEEGNFQITGAPKPGVFTPEKETETEQPPKKPSGKLPQTGQLSGHCHGQ